MTFVQRIFFTSVALIFVVFMFFYMVTHGFFVSWLPEPQQTANVLVSPPDHTTTQRMTDAQLTAIADACEKAGLDSYVSMYNVHNDGKFYRPSSITCFASPTR